MTGIIEAIVLGVVQGITEWLPVSSSGHLVLVQQLFGIDVPVVFDLLLHVATLLVLLVVFRKDILAILTAIVKGDFRSDEGRLAILIAVATIPIVLVGLLFKDAIEGLFSSVSAVGFALLFTAGLLFVSEMRPGKKALDWKSSLIVGCAQAVAVVPGISRSGATISAGLLLGIEKEKAARFSFLIFIPAVVGAMVLELGEIASAQLDPMPVAAGMIAAFAVGYISLRWLLRLVVRRRFHHFSYYCAALGLIALALSV
ncbi:undecaprenyl-diphosphate phosphatase [Candidatus Woesearchaeota archaeon]|nr:undecaprenyl-diphosphate phosphatase [Candidatus Woesearchaeota archaeon]